MNTLATQRLTLRPLRDDDVFALAAAVNNNRIARNLLRVPWPYVLDDAHAFLVHTQTLPPRSAVFAIVLRDHDEPLLGTTGYETDGLNSELGYWLAENHWGRGYMREAANAVVEHAFKVSGLERLQSRCFLGNEASRRLLTALGFRPAGIGSAYAPVRGKLVTTQNFELSAKEWDLLRTSARRSKTLVP